MNFKKYLWDMKIFLFAWVLFVGITLLLIWIYPGFSLNWDFTWYFLALEFILFLLLIGWSYLKKRDYYKGLKNLQANLDTSLVDDFSTNEEKFVLETLENIQETYNLAAQEGKVKQLEYQDYLDTWVHEIKIPLAAISLIQENIKEDIPETRYYQVENELGKINDYVEQVLYFSRLDSFAKDYVIHEYSMEKIVKENVKTFVNYFLEKHLSIQMSGEDFTVLTDEKWLGFIFRQILANSIKYTPPEGKITIHFQKGDTYDDLVIEDNGIGILPEDLPRIFAKGFTGENGRNEQKSTGLGLFLAKNLTEKLSHDILVSSIFGQGTRVTLRFFHLDDLALEN